MSTTSRWRSVGRVRLRMELVGSEVAAVILMLFVAGVVDVPGLVWFLLVTISVIVQSVLFYQMGRIREQLDR